MRKLVSVVLIVGILIAGGLFVYQRMRAAQTVGELEAIVPEEAIYYFYSYAPSKKIEELYNSQFYRKLANLSAYKQLLEPALAKKKKVFSQLTALFDSDTALAVFSVQGMQMSEAMSAKADMQLGKFLLFIRTSAGENIKTTLGDLFLRASEKQETKHSSYAGVSITNYTLAGSNAIGTVSLCYAQLGDVFVMGNDQQNLKKAIDIFKGSSTKSLVNNQIFKTLESRCAPDKKKVLLWNIVNSKKYYSQMVEEFLKKEQTASKSSGDNGQSSSLREFVEGFTAVMTGVGNVVKYDSNKQGLLMNTYQLFDSNNDTNSFLKAFATSAQGPNPILAMAPASSIGYAGLSGNMTGYFNYLKSLINSAAALAPEAGFSEKALMPATIFGVNLEKEILPLLGEHFGIVFSDIEEVSVVPQEGQVNPLQLAPTPIPQILLIVEAKDAKAAERLQSLVIDKMLSAQLNNEDNGPGLQEQAYKDVKMHILSFKNMPIPSVCFVTDKYYVFGTTLAGAKKIIDTRADIKKSLSANFAYPFDEKKLLANNSYALFLDFQKLIDKLASTKMAQFMKPTVGFFSQGKVMPDDVDAIFDLLDDIRLVVQANRVSADGVGEGLLYIGVEGL